MKRTTKIMIAAVVAIAAAIAIYCTQNKIDRLTADRDRLKKNNQTLMFNVEKYRVSDSLNAARVQSLELTIKEYKQFRANDAALIQSLKDKNRDLVAVNRTQSETIIRLLAIPQDTVIVVKDSIMIPAVAVHCGDAWYDFDGVLTEDQFSGTLHNRDSLLLAETVKYKRFLGFLWKTRHVQNRRLDCVSRNPHTEILNIEYIVIDK